MNLAFKEFFAISMPFMSASKWYQTNYVLYFFNLYEHGIIPALNIFVPFVGCMDNDCFKRMIVEN